eukprot:4900655-Ditylum_brightwellii.AAC.1
MPEVLFPVVQDSSLENGTGSGMQPKNMTDASMLSALDVPTPHIANTANTQEVVYFDVEMLCVANKQPISDITRAVRDIAGDMEEFSSNHNSNSGHE